MGDTKDRILRNVHRSNERAVTELYEGINPFSGRNVRNAMREAQREQRREEQRQNRLEDKMYRIEERAFLRQYEQQMDQQYGNDISPRGGQRAPRYNDGRQQHRDDLPYAPNGSHPQSRGAGVPAQERLSDDFSVSNGKDRFTVDNDGVAINAREQRIIAGQLSELKSWGGGDRELDALRTALDNGLSPDAKIQVGGGKEVPLDEFVKDSILKPGRQREALAMIDDARRNPVYVEKSQTVSQERPGQGAATRADEFTPLPPSQMYMTNLLRDESIPADKRVELIRENLGAIQSDKAAQHFHDELATNPQFITDYMALVQNSGLSNELKAKELAHFTAEQGRIEALDSTKVGGAINSAAGTREYGQAYGNHMSRPSTADLAQVKVDDPELQRRLQAAVSQQKTWDEAGKTGGLAGLVMTLFRPLMEMLTPDSNPMAILAEAKEKGVAIDGPETVLAKVDGRAVNANAIAQAGDAKSAEQGQGTSPGTTPAASLPEGGVGRSELTLPEAQTMSAQAKTLAVNPPQTIDNDKLLAELNAQDPRVQAQIRYDLKGHGAEISSTGNGFTKEEVAAVAKAIQEGDMAAQDVRQVIDTAIAQKGAFISQTPFVSTIPAGMSQVDVRTMEENLVKQTIPGSSYLTVDGQITPEEKQHLERMNNAPANSSIGEALAKAGLKDEVAAALAGLQNKPTDVRDQAHDGEPPRAVGAGVVDERVAAR